VTEEDTFIALTRDPFRDVVNRVLMYHTRYPLAQRLRLYSDVSSGIATKHPSWNSISGGWTFEDFKEKCRRELDEHIRQQEGRMGLHDTERHID
jgi:hypothetical protein